MFDPTIFDNLKVVLEGGLYDLDREGRIRIMGREDLIDLASMNRTFRMKFGLLDPGSGTAEVELMSGLPDFAAELAKLRIVESVRPGCRIQIRYRFQDWNGNNSQLGVINSSLQDWWVGEVQVRQMIESSHQITDKYHGIQNRYTAVLTFLQKIDEEHIGELQGLLEHTVLSLQKLDELLQTK